MRLSVALCTYNGARFLAEQLESIQAQSRPPDELVVCDDRSSDGTVDLVRRFVGGAPFPVRIEVNDRTLGVVGNFEKAIGLCTGDAIALSDQDDVWLPGRLAGGAAALECNPDVGLVFSDAEVVDEALRPIGYGIWDVIGFNRREQERVAAGDALPVLVRHPVVAGMTMTFRSCFRDLITPISIAPMAPAWIHDGWIAVLIAAVGRLGLISDRLVQYRQHPEHQIGGHRASLAALAARADRARSRRSLALTGQGFRKVAERLRASRRQATDPATYALLADAAAHFELRATFPEPRARRVAPALRELARGRYFRYSAGWVSVAQDLIL